MFQVR